MRSKLFACLLLVMVVLQAIFVPVYASGIESGGVSSYRETTIYEDFGMDPGSSSSDFESEVIGGSFSSSEPYVWEILTSCYERSFSKTSFFLYVFNRGYSSLTDSFSVTLTDDDGSLYSVSADLIDWTDHCAKICIDLVPSSSYIKTSSSEISIEVYSITCNGRSSRPYVEELDVGESNASVGLVYNVSTGKLSKRSIRESLDLNVTLMAERFSSGPTFFDYAQLNTAAFIIPDSYFERFGDLALVRYIYDLYSNVPMSVLKDSAVVEQAVGSFFDPSDSDFDFSPRPVYRPYSGYYLPFELRYTQKFLWFDVAHEDFSDFCSFNRYFTFVVDDVIETGNGGYDFTPSEVLARYQFIKDNINPPYKNVLGAETFQSFSEELSVDDSWSTESYSDYLDSLSFWNQLAFKTASSLVLHGNVIDDSINDVPAIQIVSQDLSGMTDSQISETFYVDPFYSSDLRSLSVLADSSDGQLVLLRFCLTPYIAIPCNRLKLDDEWETVEGYVCFNSIIDNFKIISFDFKKTVASDQGPVVITTTVPVNMDPVTFIDGGQSPGQLQDEFVDKWPNVLPGIFSKASSAFDWLKRVLAIVGVVLIVILLVKILTFIVSAVKFFRIRKNGSDNSDSMKRKNRRRKKRDRK
ncbi:MAG: hypothetical protein J6Z04_06720 [Clostridia bacterium]|nr:hypothetical protein [Clostridia bacterium]